jgi:hypothetical protein
MWRRLVTEQETLISIGIFGVLVMLADAASDLGWDRLGCGGPNRRDSLADRAGRLHRVATASDPGVSRAFDVHHRNRP